MKVLRCEHDTLYLTIIHIENQYMFRMIEWLVERQTDYRWSSAGAYPDDWVIHVKFENEQEFCQFIFEFVR